MGQVHLWVAALLSLGSVRAADWPMYLKDPAHSSLSTETAINRANAQSLVPAWSTNLGSPLASGATVIGNTVYTGAWDGNFHALDAQTGAILWTSFAGKAPDPESATCQPGIGITSQATVVGDTVYVGGGDSAVYAFQRHTGELLWRRQLDDPATGSYIWSSIIVAGNFLYAGIASLGDCPLVRGQLVRIPLDSPDAAHVVYLAPEGQVGGGLWTTPLIDEETNTIYITTGTGEQDAGAGLWGGTLLAFDAASLEVKAHYFLPTNSTADDIEWGSSPTLFTAPGGPRMVAATGKDGILYALDAGDLSLVWQAQLAVGCICPECGCGSISTPAFDGKTLYVGAGVNDREASAAGSVHAVDPATGATLWKQLTEGTVIAPVTVVNDLLLVSTTKGLEIYDKQTGEPLWDDGARSPLYSQATIADGTIYSTYTSGEVVAWRVAEPEPGKNPHAMGESAQRGRRR